jgi:ankyrin repeat protein
VDINLNETDVNGDTLVHFAIKKSSSECLKTLLSFNVINAIGKDSDGNTPLHCAMDKDALTSVSLRLISTVFFSNGEIFDAWPLLSAQCRGVRPFLFLA